VDVVIRKISLYKAVEFLKKHGKCKVITLAQAREQFELKTLLFKANGDNTEVQISLPRRGKLQITDKDNTIKQDCKYRDFKINALYLPIDYKSRKDVIDYVGGLDDLKNRRLSPITTAEECVMQSPVRMLRAVRLAASGGYRISDDLMRILKRDAFLLLKVPPEVIRSEFDKLLLCHKPSRYLKLLQRLGLLRYLIPELDQCAGVKQDDKYHKFDVFTHCINTVDYLDHNISLRLAGLLHDVGKTSTRKEVRTKKGIRVTFHKHEVESVRLAKAFLDRLRYDNKTKDEVLELIRMHMYHYTREYTDPAVRRFIKKLNITPDTVGDLSNLPLFKLRAAERQGNGLKKDPVTQRQLDFENRIKAIVSAGGSATIKDLDINGHILMEALNIHPGKAIGDVLEYLLERIKENKELNNRFDLLTLAIEFLRNKKGIEVKT
jgi:tRNA nucleotidyltransferase/poly(A) polymerase